MLEFIFGEAVLLAFFQSYGLVGLFLAAIISNATVFFPIPLDVFVFGLGVWLSSQSIAVFDIVVMALILGIGAAIGEMTAYILGLLGLKLAERKVHKKHVQKLQDIREKLDNKGMAIIFVGALTPFPFDIVGIAAGLIKYNPKKFFIAALFGKILRYELIIFAGFYGFEIIKAYFLIS